ncbi:MAG: thiamine diphosphokinase [Porcipelethomonas sp.]
MQNKKCYIFAGAPGSECSEVAFSENRFVICADGGYELAKRLGTEPDVVIGDFDTYKGEIPGSCEVIRYPAEKDDTDTMLAVKLALDRGYRHIVICGGLGGRLDHTIANIQTLRYIMKQGAYGELAGNGNFASLQGPGVKVYSKMNGYSFSMFSFTDECSGITATGFKYPLKNAVLRSSFPLGISNQITGKSGVVSLEKGVLLVIFSKDMNEKR